METALPCLYAIALVLFAMSLGRGVLLGTSSGMSRLSGSAFVEWVQRADRPVRQVSGATTVAQFLTVSTLLFLEQRRVVPTAMPWLFGALAMVAADGLVAFALQRPIALEIGAWESSNPPETWKSLRQRWLRWNRVCAAIASCSFLLILSAAFLYTAGL